MTDQEIEKMLMKSVNDQKPDLWNRIDSAIMAQEPVVTDKKEEKMTFAQKLRSAFFGGSSFRSAVAVFALCIICLTAVRAGFGTLNKSAASAGSPVAGGGSYYSEEAKSEAASNGYGMSAGAVADADYAPQEAVTEAEAMTDGASSAATEVKPQTGRKLIRNINLDVQTLEFDTLIADIQELALSLGGYVESSSVSGNNYYYKNTRYAQLVLRIPCDQTDVLLRTVGDAANILSKDESVRDITLAYVDVESHIKALRTEETQLLELLGKADKLEDILKIQNELSNVRYQLECYESTLRSYDNQVDFDTLTINVDEVKEVTPVKEPTFAEKIARGLKNNLQDLGDGAVALVIWLITGIPYFVVLFVVIFLAIVIIKRIVKAIAKRKSSK